MSEMSQVGFTSDTVIVDHGQPGTDRHHRWRLGCAGLPQSVWFGWASDLSLGLVIDRI
jgi:hypothetical protein